MKRPIAADLDSEAASRRARATKLRTRKVRGADGNIEKVYVLNAGSPNFGDEFLKAFQLNVRRARRATRELSKKHGVAAE
jgi:hypothetical protein